MKKILMAAVAAFLLSAVFVYAGSRPKTEILGQQEPAQKYKVTFIELGSVKCVPCKMMIPVMKEIEEKYGKEVKVIFYDVWTAEGRPYGEKYGIRGIPTQVFLDESGKEVFRHVGYFPLEQMLPELKKLGVKVD
jgi:thioredoxin 1